MSFIRSITSIIVVLLAHAAGMLGMYWVYRWFDTPVHFLGGFAAGALALDIWYFFVADLQLKKTWMRPWMIRLSFTLGIVSIIGIGWELHEFILDFVRGVVNGVKMVRQPGVADTMKDLVMDILGGFVVYAVFGNKKA